MFSHDASGVEPLQFSLAPKGRYHIVIMNYEEKYTQKGDPMVKVETRIDEGEYKGTRIFHNVCFLSRESKGAGIATHFLKTIGQPFDGKINVDPDAWIGRRFMGDVNIQTHDKNGVPVTRPWNVITSIHTPIDGKDFDPTIKKPMPKVEESSEEVPF